MIPHHIFLNDLVDHLGQMNVSDRKEHKITQMQKYACS